MTLQDYTTEELKAELKRRADLAKAERNKVKRLIRFIDAEQQNMQDVINPDAPNAPAERHPIGFNTEEKSEKKILLEENKKSSKRK